MGGARAPLSWPAGAEPWGGQAGAWRRASTRADTVASALPPAGPGAGRGRGALDAGLQLQLPGRCYSSSEYKIRTVVLVLNICGVLPNHYKVNSSEKWHILGRIFFFFKGDAEADILWLSVQRKDISPIENFFVYLLFTNFPKSFILQVFRRLGCDFLLTLPQLPGVFTVFFKFKTKPNKTSFSNKLIVCCIRGLCKVCAGKQNHVCYWSATIPSHTQKPTRCMRKPLPWLGTDQGVKSERRFLDCFDVSVKVFAVLYLL